MTRWGGLTPRGLAFLVVGVLLAVVAWLIGQPDLTLAGFGAALLPLVALAITWVAYPRLRVHRTVSPPLVPAGSDLTIDLDLVNTSVPWGAALEASDRLPPGFGGTAHFSLPALQRGQSARFSIVTQPRRRGRYALDGLRYRTTDPLGLATRISPGSATQTVRVTPMIVEVPPTLLRASGREGETPIPQTSVTGPDDVMVREYQPRDDVRRIHWPLTARTGELMVRREEQAWDPMAWILLDSRSTDGSRAEATTFEWLVSLVASWGVRLANEGFDLHLTNATGQTFAARGSVPHLRIASWLEHLVDVDLTPEDSLVAGARTVANAPSGHVLLAVLSRLDATTAHHLTAAQDSNVQRHALVVPPAEDAANADEHQRGVDILTSYGWRVHAVPVGSPPDEWRSA